LDKVQIEADFFSGSHIFFKCLYMDIFQMGGGGIKSKSKSFGVLFFYHILSIFWSKFGGRGLAEPITKVLGYL
jgi:hypothetical protein